MLARAVYPAGLTSFAARPYVGWGGRDASTASWIIVGTTESTSHRLPESS